MEHLCHARGCRTPVPPSMLMCRNHWFMVPKEIRNQVWMHYQPGQEHRRVAPSGAWHRAADQAIAIVARIERDKEIARQTKAAQLTLFPGGGP